jgi:hypothetical protein
MTSFINRASCTCVFIDLPIHDLVLTNTLERLISVQTTKDIRGCEAPGFPIVRYVLRESQDQ